MIANLVASSGTIPSMFTTVLALLVLKTAHQLITWQPINLQKYLTSTRYWINSSYMIMTSHLTSLGLVKSIIHTSLRLTCSAGSCQWLGSYSSCYFHFQGNLNRNRNILVPDTEWVLNQYKMHHSLRPSSINNFRFVNITCHESRLALFSYNILCLATV